MRSGETQTVTWKMMTLGARRLQGVQENRTQWRQCPNVSLGYRPHQLSSSSARRPAPWQCVPCLSRKEETSDDGFHDPRDDVEQQPGEPALFEDVMEYQPSIQDELTQRAAAA
eukprot:4763357-Amphidinium_carterae.1